MYMQQCASDQDGGSAAVTYAQQPYTIRRHTPGEQITKEQVKITPNEEIEKADNLFPGWKKMGKTRMFDESIPEIRAYRDPETRIALAVLADDVHAAFSYRERCTDEAAETYGRYNEAACINLLHRDMVQELAKYTNTILFIEIDNQERMCYTMDGFILFMLITPSLCINKNLSFRDEHMNLFVSAARMIQNNAAPKLVNYFFDLSKKVRLQKQSSAKMITLQLPPSALLREIGIIEGAKASSSKMPAARSGKEKKMMPQRSSTPSSTDEVTVDWNLDEGVQNMQDERMPYFPAPGMLPVSAQDDTGNGGGDEVMEEVQVPTIMSGMQSMMKECEIPYMKDNDGKILYDLYKTACLVEGAHKGRKTDRETSKTHLKKILQKGKIGVTYFQFGVNREFQYQRS